MTSIWSWSLILTKDAHDQCIQFLVRIIMDREGSTLFSRVQVNPCSKSFSQSFFKEGQVGLGGRFFWCRWTFTKKFTHQIFRFTDVQFMPDNGLQDRGLCLSIWQ